MVFSIRIVVFFVFLVLFSIGTCTIQDRINAAAAGDTVEINAADCGGSSTCSGVGNKDIYFPVAINELKGDNLAIDCQGSGRAFVFKDDSTVTVSHFSIRNCTGSDVGGAIHVSGASPTLDHLQFTSCSSSEFGGSVYIEGESATIIKSCSFSSSYSIIGGAIYSDGGPLNDGSVVSIESCSFTGNTAYEAGGSIALSHYGKISKCNISAFALFGSPPQYGGSIYFEGNAEIDGCTVSDSLATKSGGAIYASVSVAASPIISNTKIQSCSVTLDSGSGGGMSVEGRGSLHLDNVHFENCIQQFSPGPDRGGAISNSGVELRVTNSEFRGNGGNNYGGAISFSGHSTGSSLENTKFFDNSVFGGSGGAVSVDEGCDVKISSCQFSGNQAKVSGGAIYDLGDELLMISSTIISNTADFGGGLGGDFDFGSTYDVFNCTFSSNTAKKAGGATFGVNPSINGEFKNTTFQGNSAPSGNNYAMPISSLNITQPLPSSVFPGRPHDAGIVMLDELSQPARYESEAKNVYVELELPTNCSLIGNTVYPINLGVGEVTNLGVGGPLGQRCYVDCVVNGKIKSHMIVTMENRCPDGYNLIDMSCSECPPGTFNIDGITGCYSCPDGATCHGGVSVFANKNYYLVKKSSDVKIYRCPVEDCAFEAPCKSTCQKDNECSHGYKGVLCGKCSSGYSKVGTSCSECKQTYWYSVIVTLLYVFSTILLFGILHAKSFSFLKIFFNYFQTMQVLVNFTYMSLFSLDMSVFAPALFGKCLAPLSYYQRFVLSVLSPFIWIFASILCAPVIYLWRRRKEQKGQDLDSMADGPIKPFRPWYFSYFQIISSIVVFSYSPVSRTLLAYFPSRDVDGKSYLIADLGVSTSDDLYKGLKPFAIIWSLIWIIGVPAVLCLWMKFVGQELPRTEKTPIDTTTLSYSSSKLLVASIFFFSTFHVRWFYWDIIMMLRRLVLILATLEWSENYVFIRVLLAVFISLAIILVHFFVKPFIRREVNKVESFSLLCLTVAAVIYEQVPTLNSLDAADSDVNLTTTMFRILIAIFFFAGVLAFVVWISWKIYVYGIRGGKKKGRRTDTFFDSAHLLPSE